MLAFLLMLILTFLPSFIIVRFKLHWLSLVLTVIASEGLGVVLLGIPGAVFLEPTETLMTALGQPAIPADSAWGAALFISFLLPLGLILSWLLVRLYVFRSGFWTQLITFAGCYFVYSWIVSLVTYLSII